MPKYQVLLADSVMEYLDHLDKGERDRIMKRLSFSKHSRTRQVNREANSGS